MEKHFQYWMLLMASSIVCLISMTKHFNDDDDDDWSTEQRWASSVAATSLCLSGIACLMHRVSGDLFINKKPEFAVVTCVLILWCAGLPTIMDDEHSIAVGRWGSILNGNIFFSSWVSIGVGLLLFASHLELLLKREDAFLLTEWILFAATSVVVLVSGSIYFKDNDCKNLDDDEACRRSVFAVVLGSVSAMFGLLVLHPQIPVLIHQLGSILLLVSWCIASAYLTFDEGPATQVGTLYFATWFAVILSIVISSKPLLEFSQLLPVQMPTAEGADEKDGEGEIAKPNHGVKDVEGEEVDEEEVAESKDI